MNHKKIYIEAGANDGLSQSRSLHLANNDNYLGILVEPNLESYEKCVKNRKNCKVFNCALVSFEYSKPTINLFIHKKYSLMNSIIEHSYDYSKGSEVQARTLDSILQELGINFIDYLFLDTEGCELEILKGINYEQRKIKTIEVELHHKIKKTNINDEIKIFTEYLSQYNFSINQIFAQDPQPKILFKNVVYKQ